MNKLPQPMAGIRLKHHKRCMIFFGVEEYIQQCIVYNRGSEDSEYVYIKLEYPTLAMVHLEINNVIIHCHTCVEEQTGKRFYMPYKGYDEEGSFLDISELIIHLETSDDPYL